jgi:hypothetical protein
MFRIKCRVSGGVTGTREAYMKERGVVQYFATRKEAEAIADHRNKTANGPYATATFKYTVEPV